MARPVKKPPVEADYILQARRLVTANRLKNQAARDEADAKKKCVQSMHSVDVKAFDFINGNTSYHAKLDRPDGNRINVRKLYTMVQANEVTLDEFFDCITASQKAVEETLGKAVVSRLLEDYKKGLDLIIKQKD